MRVPRRALDSLLFGPPIRRPSRGRHWSGHLSCPRAPAGGPLAELLGMGAGQVGRGPAGQERVAPAAERAERSTAERVRRRTRSVSSGAQAAAFWPACALALAHKVASGTDLVVRTRAVPMTCGAWRAVAATARRPRATVGRISHACQSYPPLGAVRRAVCMVIHWYPCKCRTQWVQSLICYLNTLSHGRVS